MLFNSLVNDWGETTYVPTTLGSILLVVIILALVAVTLLFTKSVRKETADSKKYSAKQLSFCSICIALAFVLSLVKLFHFPTGGSITLLSLLVACLPGYFYGTATGVTCGLAYGILSMVIDPYILYPAQMFMDYVFAFGALGLSGIFSNSKNGLIKGYITGVFGRYVFAVLSGWIFFGSYAWDGWAALPYSLVYNAIYIFSEAAVTIIILCIPAVKQLMITAKRMATE